jgi:hypothetical protein
MRNRTRTAVFAVAAICALALAAVATAAYTTPKLSVSYAPNSVTHIVASAEVSDDATARAAIVIPNGTTITTNAAPGTQVGTVKAQVSALVLGGALLPLAGDIVVAAPGAIPAASQTACIGAAPPQVTLLLVLQAAGQTINLPAYVIPTAAPQTALGSAQLVFCLAPPDIPVDKGGATFGAKFLSADLTVNGVFGPVSTGIWTAFWTPWNPGVGTVNAAATVASPAAIAPGAIVLSGKKVKGVKRLTGKVTQAGVGVATKVTILAGAKRLATVSTGATGSFTYAVSKKSKATSFRATTVVASRPAPAVCSQFTGLGVPVPCVNATVSGFTATSGTVRLK